MVRVCLRVEAGFSLCGPEPSCGYITETSHPDVQLVKVYAGAAQRRTDAQPADRFYKFGIVCFFRVRHLSLLLSHRSVPQLSEQLPSNSARSEVCWLMFNSEQNSVNLEMDSLALWEQPWAAGPAEGRRWHLRVSTRWPLSKPHPNRSSVRSRLLKSTPFYATHAVIAPRRTVTARAATPALPGMTTMEKGTRSRRGEGGFRLGRSRLGRAPKHTDCVTPGATARRTPGQRSHLR